MSIDLNQALEYAVAWAKEVGKIQLSYFRGNDLGIQTKSNVYDVVTRADKESEAFLLDKIQKHYPGHAVFGEESGAHAGTAEYRWVIDPLDGTNNYSQGITCIYSIYRVAIPGRNHSGGCLCAVSRRVVYGNQGQRSPVQWKSDPCC